MRWNYKNKCSKIIILTILVMILDNSVVYAKEKWPSGPEISTLSAIVMEVNTGTILYEKNIHEKHYPASITKILTTLLAIENCDLDEIVTFSKDAVYKNEGDTSHISRDVGEKMTMEDCLYGVMLASANECAYAVAEHVAEKQGGTYSDFINLMNERAQKLGCTDSNFHNCNGLPDDEHLTTVYDMALISREAYHNSIFRTITGTGKYTINPTNKHSDPTYLLNHHGMLYPYRSRQYLYEYCTGGKTGYTTVAGNTLVTFAEKNGITLVCVVMRTDSVNQYVDTKSLLDFCFNEFEVCDIQKMGNTIDISDDVYGILNTNDSFVTFDDSAYIILPKGTEFEKVNSKIEDNYDGQDIIAGVTYTYLDRVVGTIGIVPSKVEIKSNIFDSIDNEPQISEKESNKKIIIYPAYILIAASTLILVIFVIILLYRISDNYYFRRHSRELRRLDRERFREIKHKHRRNKRDSIFR